MVVWRVACTSLLAILAVVGDLPGQQTVVFDSLPQWRLHEELRIGGPAAENLVRPSALAEDAAGNVYVADLRSKRVIVFDASGAVSGEAGREGEGPGEFQIPNGLGWRGDTLWVSDSRLRRVTLLTRAGGVVRTITPNPQHLARHQFGHQLALFADGSVLVLPLVSLGTYGDPTGEVAAPAIRLVPGTDTLDTLFVKRIRQNALTLRVDGTLRILPQPFRYEEQLLPDPKGTGFVVASHRAGGGGDASIRLMKIGIRGDTTWTTQIRYTPQRLTTESVDSVVNVLTEHFGRSTRAGDAQPTRRIAEQLRQAIHTPDYYPAVTGLVSNGDGTIWVRREGGPISEQVQWLSVDEAGRPTGRLVLSSEVEPISVSANHIWSTEFDELGIAYLVRYSIDKGPSGEIRRP